MMMIPQALPSWSSIARSLGPALLLAAQRRLAGWVAPYAGQRMYESARRSRLNADWNPSTSSEDAELASSLTNVRNMSRALVRDNPYAKRARRVVVNNVIGSGIGLQAQVVNSRGGLATRANDGIETAFDEWSNAEFCHTGGSLHFADIEIQAMGQVFEAGEVFIRQHYRPFGRSRIPYALELIEAERVPHEFQPDAAARSGAVVRLGIEVDDYQRPLAYWIRQAHPGDIRPAYAASAQLERVPAQDIIHLRLINRWPSTRGMPWLHAVIQRLRDMGGYTEAEIVAARAAACIMGFIKSAELPAPGVEGEAQRTLEFSAGMIERLAPGEEYTAHTPNRPNTALEAFMRFMIREFAAGTDVPYESVSCDYSQSNYSSSRLSLLDSRDLWRMLQSWFLRNFRQRVHRSWLQQAVLAGQVLGVSVSEYAPNPQKFEAARYKTRGWSWIDPTKEVNAAKESVLCGFSTVTDVISQTAGGQDLEDILKTRRHELDLMSAAGLQFQTDPQAAQPALASPVPKEPGEEPDDEVNDAGGEAQDDRVARVLPISRAR